MTINILAHTKLHPIGERLRYPIAYPHGDIVTLAAYDIREYESIMTFIEDGLIKMFTYRMSHRPFSPPANPFYFLPSNSIFFFLIQCSRNNSLTDLIKYNKYSINTIGNKVKLIGLFYCCRRFYGAIC